MRRLREWKCESGQALVLMAIGLMLLLAIMGMALDTGLLFHDKRRIQIAADAAAVAGALDYKYNSSVNSAVTAGRAAAAQNGETNGSGGVVVSIDVPPKYGPYAGTSGFVEAIVRDSSSTFFMKMFGFDTVDLAGRAVVATGVGNTSACIWTLGKSGTTVALNGSAALYAPDCDIYDDSNATDALTLSGNGTISAKSIDIVGGYSSSNNGSLTPTPVSGLVPTGDPLAGMSAPTIPTGSCSGSQCNVSVSGSSNLTLQPGNYSSVSNSGSGTVTFAPGTYIITGDVANNGPGAMVLGAGNYMIGGSLSDTGSASLTLDTGLYIIGNTLQLSGSGAITGTNVTFYTEGSTSVSGGSNLSLTAPTSGDYAGLLFFQSREDTQSMSISGSSGSAIQGIIYAPTAPLTIGGTDGMTVSLDIIADTLKVSGNGTVTNTNYGTVTNSRSVLTKIVMVE